MEPTRKARAVKKLAEQLWKVGNKADDMGIKLPNGADLGALLGSAAAELQVMIDDGQFD